MKSTARDSARLLAAFLALAALAPLSGAAAGPARASSGSGASLAGAVAGAVRGGAPAIDARAAIVIDQATGTVLYAKNPDLVIPPASLTKMVTLHVVYEEIAAGRLSKDELVTIDAKDCSPSIPYGSSLMYLQPGMRVSVLDLMRGAAVVSGNDAAYALARRVSGSNEAFAVLMNQAVRDLGFTGMRFVEPSGLSELNAVTAREYALFCRRYLELHPESIAELHSLHYIEFPRPEHATAEYKPKGRIVQGNRNTMVFSYPGCDGLKTGYIIESGYNLAATAARDGTRFIIVTLGGPDSSPFGGGAATRSRDGAVLLDWAFANFQTAEPAIPALGPLRTWYGASRTVAVEGADALAVTLPKSLASGLETRVVIPKSLKAPVAAGQRIGEVVYSSGGKVLRRVDLVAAAAVPRGNVFILVRDFFAKAFHAVFG